uniref:Uncharacterized protein n=1 Tax=Avena sativa TaxID=4498 RepID=A0ACD6A8M0_AVESA
MDTALSTEKSDVYSFGIVILEVISRKKDTHADDFSLLKSFLEVHKQGKKATNLFDTEISVAGDLELLDCLAEIAVECLNLDVNQRPSMTDVAERLLILSRSHGLHARHTVDKTRRADYSFVTGISSSLAEQDTNLHGTTISSSVSTGLYKFNNLDIFNRKGRRKFDRNVTHTLQKSHFIKIFKKEEIREIIRSSTSIEKGAFSEVYKGVADDALVAVKKMLDSNALKSKRLEDKVIIQSQIIHKNIVRLIGYCLEMDSPVLVYEFLSSGTLHDILHSGSMVPLNLDVRLSMVAESAQGLAYLHSHTHCRILHGDVRPANILLDDNFMPKITIVDASPMEEPEYIQTIRVDLAYMDPVYLQTGILTEESDVYSFGIVILEVISRKFPANNGSLVRSFLGIHKKGKKATELFDKEIAVSGNWEILDCLAEIAVQCLSPDRDERPTMTDVAERLVTLQRYRRSQVVRQ